MSPQTDPRTFSGEAGLHTRRSKRSYSVDYPSLQAIVKEFLDKTKKPVEKTEGKSEPFSMEDDLVVPLDLLDRARKIKLFLMDVDGTLTDGGVCLLSLPSDGAGDASIAELKVFNSLDGVGLNLAHTMGIKTGFITGRHSPAVSKRAKECHIDFVYLGQATKTEAFEESMRKAQVNADEVAYMGDDLPDMAVAERVGLAVAVANAALELKAICHYQTKTRGGSGTAREVIELILKAQGRWEEAIPLARA